MFLEGYCRGKQRVRELTYRMLEEQATDLFQRVNPEIN